MQFVALFLLFYLLDGWLRLPPHALVFARGRGGWRIRRRTARDAEDAMLPLRPGTLALCAAPLPLAIEDGGVRSTAPVAAIGLLRAPRSSAPLVPFAALATAAAAGTRVRTDAATLFHAIGRPQARAIAARLRSLARGDAASARAQLDADRAGEPDPAALRSRVESVERTLRRATQVCDAYALLLFVALPLAIAVAGETRALLGALPAAFALHGAALWLVRRAHRALLPDDAADRREALLAAALFPPTLLRLPQRTFLAALATPSPEVAVVALLDGDARRAVLRRALAEAELGAVADGAERNRVLALVHGAGLDPSALRAAPARGDPAVTAYCPICHELYRGDAERCSDCGIALAPFPV